MKKILNQKFLVIMFIISMIFGNLNLKDVHASRHIALNKTSVRLKKGKTVELKLRGAIAKKVKWKSLNKGVAYVKNGKVKAKKAGNTVIVARYKSKNYKCKVKVTQSKKMLN